MGITMKFFVCILFFSFYINAKKKQNKQSNFYLVEIYDGKETGEKGTDYAEHSACKWDPWSQWSNIVATCGKSSRHRNRNCMCGPIKTSEDQCGSGHPRDKQIVNQHPCENKDYRLPFQNLEKPRGTCSLGDWSAWSSCTQTCGKCTMHRNRLCTDGNRSCSNEKCPTNNFAEKKDEILRKCCGYGNWSEWSATGKTCGRSTKVRSRNCICGSKAASTYKCGDKPKEFLQVNQEPCLAAVECKWENWGLWSSVSQTCNENIRTRTRKCKCGKEVRSAQECGGGHDQDIQQVIQEKCTTTVQPQQDYILSTTTTDPQYKDYRMPMMNTPQHHIIPTPHATPMTMMTPEMTKMPTHAAPKSYGQPHGGGPTPYTLPPAWRRRSRRHRSH